MISVYTIILTLVIIPIVFVMLVWAWAMVQRILRPEDQQASSFYQPQIETETSKLVGEPISVGFREIHELSRQNHPKADYHYAWGHSEGLPLAWIEDLHERRN